MLNEIPERARRFWPILLTVFLADCTTKHFAEEHLSPPGMPHEVVGETVRFTLTYNDGGALGIPMGEWGLNLLILVSAGLVVAMALFYQTLPPNASFRAMGLALLMGGASGNLYDRLMLDAGVVDFIDVGLGSIRFWTFNVADAAIFLGALVMIRWFWNEGNRETLPS